jgi:hypothetical protein
MVVNSAYVRQKKFRVKLTIDDGGSKRGRR